VQTLGAAFASYSTLLPSDTGPVLARPEVDDEGLPPAAREALRLALAPEGGPLQDILLRELAR